MGYFLKNNDKMFPLAMSKELISDEPLYHKIMKLDSSNSLDNGSERPQFRNLCGEIFS